MNTKKNSAMQTISVIDLSGSISVRLGVDSSTLDLIYQLPKLCHYFFQALVRC